MSHVTGNCDGSRGSEYDRGTGCGKTARPGLWRGSRVTGFPTPDLNEVAARRHRDQGAQVEGYILRGVIPLFGRIKVADLKPADLADGLKK